KYFDAIETKLFHGIKHPVLLLQEEFFSSHPHPIGISVVFHVWTECVSLKSVGAHLKFACDSSRVIFCALAMMIEDDVIVRAGVQYV
ncbi:hypothetical protein Q6247_25855, partial [Klebsiella pneumoniae]